MIDPFRETVTVNYFAEGMQEVYSFTDMIPVNLTGGELVIDFSRIAEEYS